MRYRPPVLVFTAVLALAAPGAAADQGGTPGFPAAAAQSADDVRLKGLELAYNLDHDRAIERLRRAVELAPEDPATHRSLASVLWLNILFRRGAVTVDHYLGSFSRSSVKLPKPPPEIEREFKSHVERAIELAERRVSANPRSAQAHYDLGAAVGLQASYVATVEGRLLAGFRAARRCYDEHEKVLELDPSRKDAGLIVGTYRYLVSTLSLPMRVMAYVAGFGGGRERGIQALREAAAFEPRSGASSGNDSRADALFALVLVYNRERQYDRAVHVLEELRRLYPRNRLLWLEEGATALRGGRAPQAADLLTQGLGMLANDPRARVPGEAALWRYKRGAAYAALGKTSDAFADLEAASGADSQSWVHGRARVEIGRLAFKRGDRATAMLEARKAETLCGEGQDPVCLQDARTLLRSSNGR